MVGFQNPNIFSIRSKFTIRPNTDLCGVIDPGERLVRGHHGRQVGQGAHGVVAALGRVLLRGGEDKGHDEGVEVVDNTLEEHQSCDGGESFLLSLVNIFPPGSESINVLPLSF